MPRSYAEVGKPFQRVACSGGRGWRGKQGQQRGHIIHADGCAQDIPAVPSAQVLGHESGCGAGLGRGGHLDSGWAFRAHAPCLRVPARVACNSVVARTPLRLPPYGGSQEVAFIRQLGPVKYEVSPGFVPGMHVPGTFYVNDALKGLLFEELQQAVVRGDVS